MCEKHFTGVFGISIYFLKLITYRPVRQTDQDGLIETFICKLWPRLKIAQISLKSLHFEHVIFAGSTLIFNMADSQQSHVTYRASVLDHTGAWLTCRQVKKMATKVYQRRVLYISTELFFHHDLWLSSASLLG